MKPSTTYVVSMLLDTVVHCYIIALTVPPHLASGSGSATVSPPVAYLKCGEDFETCSISGVFYLRISCPEFNGTNTTVTAYRDGEVLYTSLPFQIGPLLHRFDRIFGTYTFVTENECGRDIAISRVIRQGQ